MNPSSKRRGLYALMIWHILIGLTLCGFSPGYSVFFCLGSALSFFVTAGIMKPFADHTTNHSADQGYTPAFQIASETLPLLRSGLNAETANKVAQIIQKIGDVSAVAITDREKVLVFIGDGCEKHPVGMPIVMQATRDVIQSGQLQVVRNKAGFNCKVAECTCPLETAVIAPLTLRGAIVGTVKLYQSNQGNIPDYLIKLAGGTAQLLSMQIELSELDHQEHLVTEAKLDALQSQINPHFLYNTLNTIGALIRTNPDMARRLIHRLSSFFRHSLEQKARFTSIEGELLFVRNYLILEKARFRSKLKIINKIDKSLLPYTLPVLSIQPLVENAIRHGVTPMEAQGIIVISVCSVKPDEIEISVADNGVGISPEIMPRILESGYGSGSGVGLYNVDERLKIIYGEHAGLKITSVLGHGTEIKFAIPCCSN